MRYGADQKDRTRRRLLKEAAAIIRSDGLDQLTIGAVSKRLKMTHGGFYFHFASRDDLVAQAVIGMFDNRYSGLLADTDPVDPQATLNALVDFYLSIEHRNRPQTGCPIPILASAHRRLPKAARDRLTLAVRRFTQNVATCLDRMGIDDSKARATSAVAEMVGAIALARVDDDAKQAEETLRLSKQSVRAKLGL